MKLMKDWRPLLDPEEKPKKPKQRKRKKSDKAKKPKRPRRYYPRAGTVFSSPEELGKFLEKGGWQSPGASFAGTYYPRPPYGTMSKVAKVDPRLGMWLVVDTEKIGSGVKVKGYKLMPDSGRAIPKSKRW